jgi:NAD(P)H-dependent FMN reductase
VPAYYPTNRDYEAPITVAVLVASVREGRFGPTVARWFIGEAGRREYLNLDVIDLADLDLPADFRDSPAAGAFADRIGVADAFVVITPEYNHAYPAALKLAIDTVYTGWRAKPVAFVSYGGLSGGLRAVEQLRPVFAELHAVTIRDTVSFHMASNQFDESGKPRDPAGVSAATATMLDSLTWWARSLRDARKARPYAA